MHAFFSSAADPFGVLDNLRFVTGSITTLTGDFNSDGKVDAADYVVWRNGLGSTHTQGQYQQWRQVWGGCRNRFVPQSSVPEPTGAAYFVLIALFVIAQPAVTLRSRRNLRLPADDRLIAAGASVGSTISTFSASCNSSGSSIGRPRSSSFMSASAVRFLATLNSCSYSCVAVDAR